MIVRADELADVRVRNHSKKIVLTSGTFDLFHTGHLRYLNAVKAYGDIVVVMLSGDARIKARKDSSRPIIGQDDRALILDALKAVDYVFIDPGSPEPGYVDPAYRQILKDLQPDLYVTDGEDIRLSKIMEKSQIVILPRQEGGQHASTTAIIEHITKRKV